MPRDFGYEPTDEERAHVSQLVDALFSSDPILAVTDAGILTTEYRLTSDDKKVRLSAGPIDLGPRGFGGLSVHSRDTSRSATVQFARHTKKSLFRRKKSSVASREIAWDQVIAPNAKAFIALSKLVVNQSEAPEKSKLGFIFDHFSLKESRIGKTVLSFIGSTRTGLNETNN